MIEILGIVAKRLDPHIADGLLLDFWGRPARI